MKKEIKNKIEDNFLPEENFIQLWNLVAPKFGSQFAWKYAEGTVDVALAESLSHIKSPSLFDKVTDIESANPINSWALGHILWRGSDISPFLHLFAELINKIDPISIWRMRANLTVQQEKRSRSPFHIDYDGKPLKHMPLITSIFYMNTTDGPTILEDGTEIECRANRLVSFPYDTYHAGVPCTDQPYRIVINLNYFKEIEY